MLQWFASFAEQLAAGGRDCLYSLSLPKSDRGGTQTDTKSVPCICHFGLRGPDRPVSRLWGIVQAFLRPRVVSNWECIGGMMQACAARFLALQGASWAVELHLLSLSAPSRFQRQAVPALTGYNWFLQHHACSPAACCCQLQRQTMHHSSRGAVQGFVEAVTHGVRVRASATLVPERTQLGSPDTNTSPTYLFTYRCPPALLCAAVSCKLLKRRVVKTISEHAAGPSSTTATSQLTFTCSPANPQAAWA